MPSPCRSSAKWNGRLNKFRAYFLSFAIALQLQLLLSSYSSGLMGRNSIYNLLAVSWRHLFTVSAATEESLRKRPFHPKPTLSLTSCSFIHLDCSSAKQTRNSRFHFSRQEKNSFWQGIESFGGKYVCSVPYPPHHTLSLRSGKTGFSRISIRSNISHIFSFPIPPRTKYSTRESLTRFVHWTWCNALSETHTILPTRGGERSKRRRTCSRSGSKVSVLVLRRLSASLRPFFFF